MLDFTFLQPSDACLHRGRRASILEAAWMITERIPIGTYLAVGDCNATRFDGLVLEYAEGPVVMKSRWQPVSKMRDMFHDGKISEYLTRILMEMRYVKRTDDPRWPFPALPECIRGGGPAYLYAPRAPERCVLMFVCGEPDLFDIANQLPPGNLDDHAARPLVQSRCEPLFSAIRALRSAGFAHVFLHALTPPKNIDKAGLPAYTSRLRLALLFNEIFEEFARESGVGLISIWDQIATEDGRDPRYERDVVHLNQAAAVLSVQQLMAQLEQVRRYEAKLGAQPE